MPTAIEPLAPTAADPRPEPWWHHLGKVALACLATFVLGAGVATATNRTSKPGAGSVDVGFLQDMRWHHDQAVSVSLAQVRKDGGNPTVRQIAHEIVLSQQLESGSMVEQLQTLGAAEANETGTAMTWMAMAPTPVDEMPGMATPDQLDALSLAEGKDADVLFLRMMIEHHKGGVHMAEYAAEHATTARVRAMASAMARNQTSEINEMQQLQSTIGGA